MQLDLGELKISSEIPGYVYDPMRHSIPGPLHVANDDSYPSPAPQPLDDFSLKNPSLAPIAWNIHQLTDTPYLMPEHYAILLREMAREINERGYQLTRTSKTVRDRCVERGAPVARSHVNFILFGITHTGYRFGEQVPEQAETLGEALLRNTLNLCQAARVELTEDEIGQVREWLLGGLST